jgi:hypothetical protein
VAKGLFATPRSLPNEEEPKRDEKDDQGAETIEDSSIDLAGTVFPLFQFVKTEVRFFN